VIRRIEIQSQPRQIVHKTLSRKTLHKKRTGGVAQGVGPEFKPQYCKKQNKQTKTHKQQQILMSMWEKRNPRILLVGM
jgi:glutamine amidotransferase-like uncharacterized protein